jgi:hypothetical protein
VDLRGIEAVLVLPTLNEERGLLQTYQSIPFDILREHGHRVQPVVIDGGSTDSTLEVARSLGIPILHQKSRGKGMAVREAFEWVAGRGVRFALIMDADCTYPPEKLEPCLQLLKAGTDLVIGVRTPIQTAPLGPRDIIHRVGNTILNFMALTSTGHTILDLCSGFYGVDLRSRVHEGLNATGFEVEAELFLKAHRSGLTVSQMPIDYRERVGQAKLHAVKDGIRIMIAILRSGRTPHAVPPGVIPGPGGLVRDILSACFVRGNQEVIVVSHYSRALEAQRLVDRLQASGAGRTRLVTESSLNGELAGPRPSPSEWNMATVIHLMKPEESSAPPPTVMYLSNTRRVLRMDLNLELLGDESPQSVHPGTYARSMATRGPSRTGRLAGSFATLGSVLDSSGSGKEVALLGANGLKPTVLAEDRNGPIPPHPSAHLAVTADRDLKDATP